MRVAYKLSKPLAWMLSCAPERSRPRRSPFRRRPAVKIGFAAPMTGANAGYGKDLAKRRAARASTKPTRRTSRSATRSRSFQIVAQDDQADPRIGVQVAQKLVDAASRWWSATSIRARRFPPRRFTSRPAFR